MHAWWKEATVGLVEAVGSVLGNYANFSGRARRSEFWWWWLAVVLVGGVFAAVAALFGSGILGDLTRIGYWLFGLATIVPTLAVSVRRLHDIGRSGWWILIGIVPVVGNLILFVFHVMPSTRGPNAFGPQPR